MNEEFKERLDQLEKNVGEILKTTKQTKTYFQIFLIVTVGSLIIPIIGLAFALPKFLSIYGELL